MKDNELIYTTTILRYDGEKWYKCKNCDYIQNFRFANREFYLVKKDGMYFVTTDKGADIASVYIKSETEKGEKILPGEVVSLFRKEYLKHDITQEKIETFLNNPQEYRKKYQQKKAD